MRAALIGVAVAVAAASSPVRAGPPGAGASGSSAGIPILLAEHQVTTLEFDRPVARVSVTDPALVAVRTRGSRVELGGLRGGRASVEIAFEDGATVSYDVGVLSARRPPPVAAGAPGVIELAVGEARQFRAPGVERVLLEENGVAKVSVHGEAITVTGATPGGSSLVLVDGAGTRTTVAVTVR